MEQPPGYAPRFAFSVVLSMFGNKVLELGYLSSMVRSQLMALTLVSLIRQ